MPTIARAPIAVLPNVGMSQSAVMVGALIGGFVVFLALQQKLGVYWAILIGGGSSATTPAATTPTPSTTTTSPSATPSPTIPSSQGSILGLGGTTATLPATGTQGGTVGYNAFTGAGSGLTPGSAWMLSGVGN